MPEPEVPRQRRRRNSLTIDEVLAAAEQVAQEGIDALTIRAVANELQSSPMALYRYVATKEELVAGLLDRVLARIRLPPETADWVEDLRVFAHRHLELLTRHPWAITALMRNPYPGPSVLPIGEHALRILDRAGITGDGAVASFSGIIALNYGWASFAAARSTTAGDREAEPAALPTAPPAFPLTARVAEPMSRYGSKAHYERALNQLIAGIAASAGVLRQDA
jgi:AcrR family transcriptional regulator